MTQTTSSHAAPTAGSSPQNANESKRIRRFRTNLIKEIPRFPNNRASKQALEGMHLTDLLIVYMSWRLRLVGRRERKVVGADALWSDGRAVAMRPNLEAFFAAVERGDDLTPYLSLRAMEKGYRPPDPGQTLPTWDDKDFILNVFGLHHFHLGLTTVNGHIDRTDEVLFARVTRDTLEPLALFDHSVFDTDASTMTSERERLWTLAEDHVGSLGGVTTAGTPTNVTFKAIDYVDVIREIDPKLDDRAWIMESFKPDGPPSSVKPEWWFNHLDLGVMDTKRNVFGKFRDGPT